MFLDPPGFNFAGSRELSLGVELELQIIDAHTGDLAPLSQNILNSLAGLQSPDRGAIVPEVTAGMIEISTGICANASGVQADLEALRDRVSCAAAAHGALLAGGGMHPFKHWSEQQIFDSPRYRSLFASYGEVLKQTTVFGQHIHLGCSDVHRVPLLMHQLARYVPHFVALSASSPFMEGHDTRFDSTRLNCPSPFPTGPCAPFTLSWNELTDHLVRWLSCGVIESIKDLHWDIRPKPEFGTVEIRVLDSPLTIKRAASLACFAQLLGAWLLIDKPFVPRQDDHVVYAYNKFQAARFGLDAVYIDPGSLERIPLAHHLGRLLKTLSRHAKTSADEDHLAALRTLVETRKNDASILRAWLRELGSFGQVALRSAAELTDTESKVLQPRQTLYPA
ncbi:YbdK family carboxylate-amine ligase [Variovorax sp. J22G73]|uniref:YbdK family carboxylate-amine ligase n=1 Tax=unclassified Variovorax TaxID=663243 RepID=UPI00257679B1|nr:MULTISPECIES: YbdK family carboxylate-amine ligase [unclassified Variovorax]MDM0009494.1 YbdK family carboxylate-amine ligase [Variovorax sp. J22R203]MDM0102002.1 YbdK family carboxylate-amine ligase [Variovorax sp. J22G73]